jgi:hypothetical protein
MDLDYTFVKSLSKNEFDKRIPSESELEDTSKFTKSDAEEINRVERLLDVSEGTLAGIGQYVEKAQCECGKVLTMYDLVFTGLVDAKHQKSFILHTMVGNKFVVNPARPIRCSLCSRVTKTFHRYRCRGYGCAG